MDTYQAVYDAVRSKIGHCDPGQIIRDACHLDASFAIEGVRQDFRIVADEMQRPAAVFRPRIFPDGDQWCALYGDDLMAGVAGFGKTPSDAMHDFDRSWLHGKASAEPRADERDPFSEDE